MKQGMKNARLCREKLVPELEKLFREVLAVAYRIRQDSAYNVEVALSELGQQLVTITEQAEEIEA